MKPHFLFIILGVILAAAALGTYGLVRAKAGQDLIVWTVEKGDFEIVLRTEGRLAAVKTTVVTCPVWWRTVIRLAPEGTRVKKGEVVARFDRQSQEERLERHEDDIAAARASLARARIQLEAKRQEMEAKIALAGADLEIARVQYETLKQLPRPDELRRAKAELEYRRAALAVAEEEFDRTRELYAKRLVSAAARRSRESEFHRAKDACQVAESDYELTKAGASAESLRQAKLRYEQAVLACDQAKRDLPSQLKIAQAEVKKFSADEEKEKADMDRCIRDLERHEVKATADGLVVYAVDNGRKVGVGTTLWRGRPIMELPDLREMELKAYVNESDRQHLKIGLPARIRVDAVPGEVFQGKVRRISKIAHDRSASDVVGWGEEQKKSGINVFDVYISILAPGADRDSDAQESPEPEGAAPGAGDDKKKQTTSKNAPTPGDAQPSKDGSPPDADESPEASGSPSADAKAERAPITDERLRPNLTARGVIILERIHDALTVPEVAVFTREGKPFVRIRKGRHIIEKEVQLGPASRGMVHVTKGVKALDQVILAR